jgi:CHAT domain-containing protein
MEFLEFKIGAWQVNENEAQVILFDSPVGGLRQPITVASNVKQLHADFKKEISQGKKERFRELGKQLSQIILPQDISKRLARTMDRIPQDSGIRIRLCLDESLVDLPWEYIFAPEIDAVAGFLILNPRISLVRETSLISQKPIASIKKQRLVFYGAYKHDKTDHWQVKEEYERLKSALEKVQELLLTDFFHSPNSIDEALSKEAEIFYYSGHVDKINGRGYLITELSDNLDLDSSDKIYSDDLAIMLRKSGIKLAIFSACNSGRWYFIKPLIQAGIPLIIGAYDTITTDAAISFCDKLFSALAVGLSFDESVSWARLRLRENECLEWGSFMVYMPSNEAIIFPRPQKLEIRKKITDQYEREKEIARPAHIVYSDFWIHVQRNGDISASSEKGSTPKASEMKLDLHEIRQLLNRITINNSSLRDRIEIDKVREIGHKLSNALFPDFISNLYWTTVGGAKEGSGVHIRLTFDNPEYASLPWEFLYDDYTDQFLATDTTTPLSRYVNIPKERRDPKPISLPLKILLIVSRPVDADVLYADNEIKIIRKALQDHINSKKIDEPKELPKAYFSKINDELEKSYDIVHFIGHGTFQEDKGSIALPDEDNGDRTILYDDQHFADLFRNKPGLGLVILDACQGAKTSASKIFAGMAPLLVQAGIPAVIAMQYDIGEKTSEIFARKFYGELALGKPVDEAIQLARYHISINPQSTAGYFAIPVLYTRAKDGVIFDLPHK